MNGRERLLTMLDGGTVDSLPLMPITMMYAADHSGVKYGQYATDHRVSGRESDRGRPGIRFRLRFLHLRSGSGSHRLRGACGDLR